MKKIDYKIFVSVIIFIIMNVISIESIGSVHKKINKLQNKSIVDSSKFLDLAIYYIDDFTFTHRGYTQVKVFKNDKLLRDIESDINGKLRLILEPENEFKIIAIIEGYPAMLYVNTKGVSSNFNANYHTLRYDFPVGKNRLVPPSNNEVVYKSAEVFFNPTLKKFKINSEVKGFVDRSNLVDKDGKKVSFKVEILEKKGSIVRKDANIVFYLSIRAADVNKSFNECKMIQNGKVILNPNNYKDDYSARDSALLQVIGVYNFELKTRCSTGGSGSYSDQEIELKIDCPDFFKKSVYLNLYGLLHKFACKQVKPDTINVLLDSCFLADRKAVYSTGANYFYTGKGILERSFKLQKYELESIKMYKEMVEKAKVWRNEFYNSNHHQQIRSTNLNAKKVDTTLLSNENPSEANQRNLEENQDIQSMANDVLLDMDSMDTELPAIGKIEEVIFKNQAPNLLSETTKKKFEKFGFDTLKIYTERKVKQHLKLLEKSTAKLKTAEDTLSLYAQLYSINKDFIFIGKKRIEELSSDTGNRLLIEEIKKGVDEKELENYFIKKEVNDLRQKLKNKTLELENERNKFLFVLLLLLTFVGFSIVLFRQNKKVKELNALLTFNINEIKDSINYSKRIQDAMLPQLSKIKVAFPQSFILFKPKDIVSGDFYWFQELEGKKYIAACDCTGHGVPGALMSMVATDMLNEALVHTKKVDEILAHTNRSIRVALKQSSDDDSTRDGMDIALCCFDDQSNILKYAGAYRPLWLIRTTLSPEGRAGVGFTLAEFKATKAAIGGLTEDNQVFQINEIQLQKGDTIYLSSDGYADQFSPADKKLMTKRFKEILLSIQPLSMPEQEKYLEKFITDWRGNMEQTDDVLVIGVRV
jgi:serine phosphatase RsbU (regulator of sigma subunit)